MIYVEVGMHFLEHEENEFFKLVDQIFDNGNQYDIYKDDYSQSFVIAWRDASTDELHTYCCGSYNGYEWDLEGIIASQNDKNF